jgi:hypothetical protein
VRNSSHTGYRRRHSTAPPLFRPGPDQMGAEERGWGKTIQDGDVRKPRGGSGRPRWVDEGGSRLLAVCVSRQIRTKLTLRVDKRSAVEALGGAAFSPLPCYPKCYPSHTPQQQEQQLAPWSECCLTLLPRKNGPPSGSSSGKWSCASRKWQLRAATATAAGELFLFGGLAHNSLRNDLYMISTWDLSATLLQTSGEVPSPRFMRIGDSLLMSCPTLVD